MKVKDFSFFLPKELIAQSPAAIRGQSRLMVLDPQSSRWEHSSFLQLVDFIEPTTVIVFNNSKVRRARVFAQTEHGGKIEVIFLRPLPDNCWECLVKKSKKLREKQHLVFPGGVIGRVEAFLEESRILSFSCVLDDAWLQTYGHIPLPPYIHRSDSGQDENRYQTVYAQEIGSAAAPTAGLHFTQEILQALRDKGVEIAYVTLHIGLGTFLPVRVKDLSDHKMHKEVYHIDQSTKAQLDRAKHEGKKLLAVGTTSLRTLESAWDGQEFQVGFHSTNLFISPGYRFQVTDQLLTNFHTPESTLLMLAASFAGWDFLRKAYLEAVEEKYRFYSYGDAMFLQNHSSSSPSR